MVKKNYKNWLRFDKFGVNTDRHVVYGPQLSNWDLEFGAEISISNNFS